MAADVERDPKPVSFFTLFRYHSWLDIFLNLLGCVCGAAAGSAQPLMTILMGRLVTQFVNFTVALASGESSQIAEASAEFKDAAAKNALYLVILGIGAYVVVHTYMFIWIYTGEKATKRIREEYLKALLRQNIAFFDTLGAGEIVTRIQSDTHIIQIGISEKVPLIASALSGFLTGYIVAYVRSWRLALALSSILPCVLLIFAAFFSFHSKYEEISLKAISQGATIAEQVISTIRTTKALGAEKKLFAVYQEFVNTAAKAMLTTTFIDGALFGIFFFIQYGAYALAFYYGTTLILYGIGNAGTVVNVFLSLVTGSLSLILLMPFLENISNARVAAAKLFATIDRVPTIDSASEEGLRPEVVHGHITFENVLFEYPSRPNVKVLKSVNMTFEAGKSTALVGPSGCGKSTTVALVERFYDPLNGSIKLDGHDLRSLNVRWLRSQIGLVGQEPVLFATTVKQNIAYGLTGTPWENTSVEEQFRLVREACIKANADGFISKLPEGYDTNVGQAGLLLSGGQKQRIAIARAIVSNPKILLLDEATSALDTMSERVVQNALEKVSQGRTIITIAHRLSTIKNADKIYVLNEGSLEEEGTHNELLRNPDGPYSVLVHAQQLRELAERAGDPEKVPLPPHVDQVVVADEEGQEERSTDIPLRRIATGPSVVSEAFIKRSPMEDDEEGKRRYPFTVIVKRLARLNRRALPYYISGALFATANGMIYPLFGIVFANAINGWSSTDPTEIRHAGNHYALLLFIIAICSGILFAGQNSMTEAASVVLTQRIRALSFETIMRQDVGWFDDERHSVGALTAGLSENARKVGDVAGDTLGTLFQAGITVIGGGIVGLCYGWKLSLVGLACVPFLLSAGYLFLRVVMLKDERDKLAHEDSAQFACEVASAVRTIVSLTREEASYLQYRHFLDQPFRNAKKTALVSGGFFGLSQGCPYFVIALMFWYGSRLVASQEYTTVQFFVCLMSGTFGVMQVATSLSFMPDVSSGAMGSRKLFELLDSTPEIDTDSPDGKHIQQLKGQVAFRNVHFRYPTRLEVRVLRGLNLDVQPGQTVAVCGPSGCGKSTTVQLIERFYEVLYGVIYVDGIPLPELNVANYRKNVGIVSQEPNLYAGSLKFNLLLGATNPDEVTQADLDEACREANILEFIKGLPEGLDTDVGNKGTALSGGQKQRVAIARALIRKPKILLLDEATSALDSTSEHVVQLALDNAARGRTTVTVAHRLSTIQNADRIYFMQDGRVAEAGTHDELVKLRGGYYELVRLQALTRGGQ
ncbi:multidrug resistance protein 1 [Dacryopinax primogenitus]|uniref:Multidrug resistance protein 1 n=1 Tax=Dacryopinax primogenitus (strain DJM 731) TaxID=1858805 RepID=M5FYU2_DACPD|nr:multidrug resistance protein 1 [Dacryopinax primogenitus]EJU03196.1 multidrug resistance protein 1 [Dacryopinax primogenitus]